MMFSREIIQILRHQHNCSYSMFRGLYRQFVRVQTCRLNEAAHNTFNTRHQSLSSLCSCDRRLDIQQICAHSSNHNMKVRLLHVSIVKRKQEQNKSGEAGSAFNNELEMTNDSSEIRQNKTGNDSTKREKDIDTRLNKPQRARNDKIMNTKQTRKLAEADAFIKNRFYDIQKATDNIKITQLNLARKRGEIISDGTHDVGNKTMELEQNSQAIYLKPEKTPQGSQLTVPKWDITTRTTNMPSYSHETGVSESIIRSLVKEVDDTGEVSTLRNRFADLEGMDDNLPAKVEFPKLYHVAPLVNESLLLRNLVKIGVDLSKLEKDGCAEVVMQMDFKRDVKPLLLYLHDIGVPGDRVANVLNKYTGLLTMNLNHLKTRIAYLRSKKFKREAIVSMMDKDPNFLRMSTVELDRALGFLQKQLWLTEAVLDETEGQDQYGLCVHETTRQILSHRNAYCGGELRTVVSYAPKLITRDPYMIQSSLHVFQEELGFTKREIKLLVQNYASVLTKLNINKLAATFHYLHQVMGIPHSLIIAYPQALKITKIVLVNRHQFLVKLGRDQYDPNLPNYVSLERLLLTEDAEFSCDIAKASLAEFNDFLRTV